MSILNKVKSLFAKISRSDSAKMSVPLGRNSPCHCGSGLKYKRCHLREDQAKAAQQFHDKKMAELNRSHEPQWNAVLGPEGTLAQKGFAEAPETLSQGAKLHGKD